MYFLLIDEKKIPAVKDWPTPKDATEVRQIGILLSTVCTEVRSDCMPYE